MQVFLSALPSANDALVWLRKSEEPEEEEERAGSGRIGAIVACIDGGFVWRRIAFVDAHTYGGRSFSNVVRC